jgi:hypothetical protein
MLAFRKRWQQWWRRSRGVSSLLVFAVVMGGMLAATPALSATITTVLEPFAGDDSEVTLTLDDSGEGVSITVEVTEGVADIRGVFFDLNLDEAYLDDLQISVDGDDVTDYLVGSIINTGGGNNLNGGGSPCPCDVGVEIGTPGMGKDDIQSTTFVVTHDSLDLTLAMFFEQDIGVRLTSVGDDLHGSRNGSSKLGGTVPVPEPNTVALLGLGLLYFAGRRRA